MSRVRASVAFVLLLLSGLGATSFGETNARCAQTCPDDDDDGQCPPGCVDCTCCVRAPMVVPSDGVRFVVFGVEQPSPASGDDALPPQPPLQEVDHVPKLLRA